MGKAPAAFTPPPSRMATAPTVSAPRQTLAEHSPAHLRLCSFISCSRPPRCPAGAVRGLIGGIRQYLDLLPLVPKLHLGTDPLAPGDNKAGNRKVPNCNLGTSGERNSPVTAKLKPASGQEREKVVSDFGYFRARGLRNRWPATMASPISPIAAAGGTGTTVTLTASRKPPVELLSVSG